MLLSTHYERDFDSHIYAGEAELSLVVKYFFIRLFCYDTKCFVIIHGVSTSICSNLTLR